MFFSCLEREEAHCKFAADGNWKKRKYIDSVLERIINNVIFTLTVSKTATMYTLIWGQHDDEFSFY